MHAIAGRWTLGTSASGEACITTQSHLARDADDRGFSRRQSARFLGLYALASAGGSASYAPFLTLLLPIRAFEIAGENAVELLSYIAFAGALAASLSNIAFGWASDRTHGRRGWIVAGLLISCSLLVSVQFVRTTPQLVAVICAWQVGLNMMLAPLAAWAGDTVPDQQKGLLGGLLSLAPGAGAMVGAFVTLPGLADGDQRLWLVAGIVMAMVLPAVVFGAPRPMPELSEPREQVEPGTHLPRSGLDADAAVWRMWLARLLMQISEAALFAFLLVWLSGLDGGVSDHRTATVFTMVTIAGAPIALIAGRWSDRQNRPMAPLAAASLVAAVGLVLMAISSTAATAIGGYLVFGVAAGVFLALHTSQTLRVLPRPQHRGRDLGLFNLTNTIPSLIMPAFSLTLVPVFGFRGLFVLLAVLAALSFVLLPRRTTVAPANAG